MKNCYLLSDDSQDCPGKFELSILGVYKANFGKVELQYGHNGNKK
jgi:hypothetical protein